MSSYYRPVTPLTPAAITRRQVLRLAGAAAIVGATAACGSDPKKSASPSPSASGVTLENVGGDAAATLNIGDAQAELVRGDSRYALGLVGPDGPVTGADVTVYVGKAADQPPERTAKATELVDTGLTGRGVYVATLPFPTEGEYLVAVVARTPSGALRGGTKVTVTATSPSPTRGQRPPMVTTPTTAAPIGADPLCSQRPKPCSMHAVSLDKALRNGKPTLVTFAAPSFCETEFCGPVVTILQQVATEVGDRANFIHVEAFRGATKPGTGKLAPALQQFKFTSEPWLYVMDSTGVVAGRISGAFSSAEVRDLLRGVGIT